MTRSWKTLSTTGVCSLQDQLSEGADNQQGAIYNIARTDNTQDLQHCKDSFKNIIEQCISNENSRGGTWSLGGETYSISNSVFPNDPLAPMTMEGQRPICLLPPWLPRLVRSLKLLKPHQSHLASIPPPHSPSTDRPQTRQQPAGMNMPLSYPFGSLVPV